MDARTWREVVRSPDVEPHVVQLYRDDGFLARGVAAWVAEPLRRGGGALLVCTPANARLVLARLPDEGVDPVAAEASGRLVIISADGLLARFMLAGNPDAGAFRRLAHEAIEGLRAACAGPDAEVRAWGEMVNLLWQRGNLPAAQRLEALWNEVIAEEDIRLLCSYAVDNLDARTHAGLLHDVCAGHARLLPEEDDARFEDAVALALAEVLGPGGRGLPGTLRPSTLRIAMPPGQAVLVALHETQPAVAGRVLAATRRRLAAPARL